MSDQAVPFQVAEFESGSFRDPSNRVVEHDGLIYRLLDETALSNWEGLHGTRFFRSLTEVGRLVETELIERSCLSPELEPLLERWAGILRHHRIPVVSYPYEWPFSMLQDAARLQLEVLEAALREDFTLKDGTPFNVQWTGSSPCFIDLGSFEPWQSGEVWAGYRQFCQLYLFPLMLRAYKNVPYHTLLRSSLEGIEPGHFASLMSLRDLLRPGVLVHGQLQARLLERYGRSDRDVRDELRKSGFRKDMILANLRRLRRLVDGLAWTEQRSEWSAYTEEWTYDEKGLECKRSFVAEALAEKKRARVWDLGANTGLFARLAADYADYVVALDADELAIDSLYRELRREGNEQILPLVMNVCQPSPNQGWRGRERRSLENRDRPDLILCLALIHHVVITGNLPVVEFLDWLREQSAEVVIEFPTREDDMVRRLLRNKREPHEEYRRERFEAALTERFVLRSMSELPSGTRYLYHAAPS